MEDEIIVSICCITYNHEKYIADALEGFLMQETDFKFEVIIHDDASTDRTADIIRSYEQKYPEIIKPIYQTENQYSKGVKISTLVFKQSKGKYIALCEGDDYWIDPLKLQKQITEMEKHPECYISFHPALVKWEDGSKKDKTMCFHSKKQQVFTIEEVILGGGAFMPTNSIVINKTVINRIISFFNIAKDVPVGDYYIQILSSENCGALYINDVMSVYRSGLSNSWSKTMNKSSKHSNLFINLFIVSNNKMNEFTNNKYCKQFRMINKQSVSARLKAITVDTSVRKNIFEYYSEYVSFTDKILWYTIFRHSKITNIIQTIRGLISTAWQCI